MTISTKIGFGKKVSGEVRIIGKNGPVDSRDLMPELEGKIVVFLSWVSRETLEKANFLGVCGVVVPSIHARDFDYYSKTHDFSLLVLVKFGKLDIPNELAKKLSPLEGKKGELDGEGKTLTV